ncbi:MAG TPA: hypothetical protein VGK87_10035 [Anaerolineae bacterium]
MNEWGIIGHDWAVNRLLKQVASRQLAQSLLITGRASVGKATLALAFAGAALSIQSADAARTVQLAMRRKHPDLMWVTDDNGIIKTDTIRDVMHTLSLTPVEGRYRLVIIDNSHLTHTGGQNAILKMLEEPNPSTIIVLLAPTSDSVLPTITSRCQVLNLHSVATKLIYEALIKRGVPQENATLISVLSRGRPGWALRAIADESLLLERTQHITDLEQLIPSNRTSRFTYAEALAKADDETLNSVLEEWTLYWLDIVRAHNTANETVLHNIDRADAIRRVAERVDVSTAAQFVNTIAGTVRHIQLSANTRLALDVLMLRMPVV